MMVLVSYDVAVSETGGQARLRKVARTCENYGQRVQFSVFECLVDPAEWAVLKAKLVEAINPEQDSLRFYYLGANWERRVEHVGAKPAVNPEGPLVI
ncbi:CRISPR-associated endonuclease Cas2 [Desulfocurvibacter africanus]|uniref:CRISPR-associated endonuclease Cas2 n=1 Tax=Desulfocurvibacter africanus TaxID=873 RepID=UPI002FD9506E